MLSEYFETVSKQPSKIHPGLFNLNDFQNFLRSTRFFLEFEQIYLKDFFKSYFREGIPGDISDESTEVGIYAWIRKGKSKKNCKKKK